MATSSHQTGCIDQCSPVRNRYFYGKMLDVYHFELEQNYFNSKRWLLNRLVSGYGVVCGLNVLLSSDLKSLYVTPGVAIDKCGHEIIVCKPSAPIPLPVPTPPPAQTGGGAQTPPPPAASSNNPTQPSSTATPSAGTPVIASSATPTTGNGASGTGTENCDCADYYHLMLCYHECPTDPSPNLGGDCDTRATCSPGAIRERYMLELVPDKLAAARTTSALSDLINGGTISYQSLATYVSNLSLDDPCPDCCIALANIRVPAYGTPYDLNSDIDISVRPIVYTNDLLYEMILAMKQGPATTTARKP
jgi:hypothetical protein